MNRLYFKGLQLNGFKSFADKTDLEFNDGITSVVGPNGSGKSNISDAIRWVMGEMSAKSLRGSKMEDVIFCGSEKRKPQGFAEVTIVLDNSDHSMNIDYSEVSVTRKVYRSGESEYYINKTPCRLRDISELFMDTGLGRDGYSIIGQGKIDAILSAKSEERRHIFDEAAGITKYRYKKNEAEKKLAHTEENLTRVKDIIIEIEGRLFTLQSQSEKAQKYLLLRDEKKDVEISLWLIDLETIKLQLEKLDKNLEIVTNQAKENDEKILNLQTEIDALKETMRVTEGEIDKTKSLMYAKREEITTAKSDIDLARANILHGEKDLERINNEIAAIRERKQELDKLITSQSDTYTSLSETLKSIKEEIQKYTEELIKVSGEIEEENKGREATDNEVKALFDKIAANNVTAATCTQLISSLEERAGQIRELIKQQDEKIEKNKDEIYSVQAKIEDLKQQENNCSVKCERFSLLMKQTEEKYNNSKSDIIKYESELKSLQNRKTILEDLENSYDGYSKSVKAIMQESKNGALSRESIYGPVSSLIGVERKYVTAIEIALGGNVNNIVVEDENDAKAAIDFLKNTHGGRATFMPVSSVRSKPIDVNDAKSMTGYIDIASNLVKCDKKYSEIIKYLLCQTVVVDNYDNAVKIARKFKYGFKIVTLDGEFLNTGGSISGGSNNRSSGNLSRKDEIARVTAEIEETNKLLEKAITTEKENELRLTNAKKDFEDAQRELWESKNKLEKYMTSAQHILSLQEDIDSSMEIYETELKEIAEKTKNAQETLAQTKTETDSLQETLNEVTDKQGLMGDKILKLRQYHLDVSNKINELRISEGIADKDLSIAVSRKTEFETELKNISEREIQLNADIENIKSSDVTLTADIAAKEELVKTLESEVKEADIKLIGLEDVKKQEYEKRDKFEELMQAYNATAVDLQAENGRLEAKKVKYTSDNENILSKLWDEYEITFSEALKHKITIEDIPAAQKQLQTIKNSIKALGHININAIEEYRESKERYDFLTAQEQDITAAKTELLNLIAEMENIMKTMFDQNFKKLNEKFAETFSELFGGGTASLSLSDPENLLESGVDINVQPPGKNLQNISLLSGGEKAFTAIAIIFSILKINPTPFCIFDEIEAALDDANVYRFADYLKKLSKNTQFILITHRKGTMEVADRLYGVTMQEKGVTRLLSLDMDKMA